MKFASRRCLPLAALVLLCGTLAGRVTAQAPNPKYDPLFAKARSLEALTPEKAFDAYAKVKNENNSKDPEIAADALLRASLFGYARLTQPPTPETQGQSEVAKEARQQTELTNGVRGHDAAKELFDPSLRGTNAAKFAEEPHFGRTGSLDLKQALETELDKRNSQLFSYKLVDSLVAVTGRIPGFSYWFALVLVAIVVKGLTMPITLKMYKSQREMQRLQPHLKELQEKYKGKPAELNEQTMKLYKEHNVNPLASCLPMLIQLPFMYLVYNTIRLYEYHFSNGKFLWIGSSLAHRFPDYVASNLGRFDIVLLILYAGSNYITMKLTPPTDPAAAQQQKSMSVMMSIVMFVMFLKYRWSSAFTFYWLILNILSAWQQYHFIYKPNQAKQRGTASGDTPGAGGGRLATEAAKANGNGSLSSVRPVTPVQNPAMRARPRRKKR